MVENHCKLSLLYICEVTGDCDCHCSVTVILCTTVTTAADASLKAYRYIRCLQAVIAWMNCSFECGLLLQLAIACSRAPRVQVASIDHVGG